MWLVVFLGCFMLPSLTECLNETSSTCPSGRLIASCDAGKVILINRVYQGYYSGAPSSQHCSYQNGDTREYHVRTNEVWKDCNLHALCSVLYRPGETGSYYLQMDYECVDGSANAMRYLAVDICGGHLKESLGYIRSPCYPYKANLKSIPTICSCSGTLPSGYSGNIIARVFHAFQNTESLKIRWRGAGQPVEETITSNSPNFVTFDHYVILDITVSFQTLSSGSEWDRVFWLEYSAGVSFNMYCRQTEGESVCPTPTTTTTTTTTPAPPTTTTLSPPISGPISTTGTGADSRSSSTVSSVTDGISQPQGENKDLIAIIVGTVVPVIIIIVVVPTVIIILRKKRKPGEGGETAKGDDGFNGSVVNPSFDPESGEHVNEISLYDNAGQGESSDDPIIPIYSTEGQVQPETANVGVDGTLYADITVGGAAPATRPSPSKPWLKPKPAARTKSGEAEESSGVLYADMAFANEGDPKQNSEYNEAPPGDVYAVVNKPSKGNKGKAPVVQTDNLYSEVDKGSKKKKDAKPGGDSNVEQTGDVYAEVDKSAKKQTQRKPEVAKRSIPKGGAHGGSSAPDAPSGDVYAQVQKGRKTKPAPPAGKRSNDYQNVTETSGSVDDEGDLGNYDDGALYGRVEGD